MSLVYGPFRDPMGSSHTYHYGMVINLVHRGEKGGRWSSIDKGIRCHLNEEDLDRLRVYAKWSDMPLELLSSMLPLCATEVLQNPAFRLAMACDRGFFSGMSRMNRAAIAACPAAEPALVRKLGGSRDRPVEIRIAAAGNPSCPKEMLWEYLKHRWEVRVSLARNPALPEALLRALSKDENWKIRAQVSLRPNLSESLFKVAVDDDDWHVRRTVVSNPRLPEHLMRVLRGDPYYRVREEAYALEARDQRRAAMACQNKEVQ